MRRHRAWGGGVTSSRHEVVGETQAVDGAAEEDLACLGWRSRFDISGDLNIPGKLIFLSRMSFPSSSTFLCFFPPKTFF